MNDVTNGEKTYDGVHRNALQKILFMMNERK